MKCSHACGNCRGSSCSTSSHFTCEEDIVVLKYVIGSYACFPFYLSFFFFYYFLIYTWLIVNQDLKQKSYQHKYIFILKHSYLQDNAVK